MVGHAGYGIRLVGMFIEDEWNGDVRMFWTDEQLAPGFMQLVHSQFPPDLRTIIMDHERFKDHEFYLSSIPVCFFFLTFWGRNFFASNSMDEFRSVLNQWGVSGAGKTTIAEIFMGLFIPEDRQAPLTMNNWEKVFGIGQLFDSWFVCAARVSPPSS